MIKQSLAKADKAQLPQEFQNYAEFLRDYQSKNPGKFFIAKEFGAKIAGSKKQDLMSQKDYARLFGETPGDLPAELKKALDKYRGRLLDERAQKDAGMKALLDHLSDKKSKKTDK